MGADIPISLATYAVFSVQLQSNLVSAYPADHVFTAKTFTSQSPDFKVVHFPFADFADNEHLYHVNFMITTRFFPQNPERPSLR